MSEPPFQVLLRPLDLVLQLIKLHRAAIKMGPGMTGDVETLFVEGDNLLPRQGPKTR